MTAAGPTTAATAAGEEQGRKQQPQQQRQSPTTASWAPPSLPLAGESFVMQSGRRIPLEKGVALDPPSGQGAEGLGRCAIGCGKAKDPRKPKTKRTKKKKKKKTVRFPQDDTEFYSNIWGQGSDHETKFIDIAQVAYLLTVVDYKSDYDEAVEGDTTLSTLNIWTADFAPMTSDEAGDTEHPNQSPAKSSSTLSDLKSGGSVSVIYDLGRSVNPPSQFKTLERILSYYGIGSASAVPVAPPTKRSDRCVVFSAVLSQGDTKDTWSAKFLLGLHEPVRHALYVIDQFLDRGQQKESPLEWNTATFFTWFNECFTEYLQAQKQVKSIVLTPLVRIKYSTKHEILSCYEEITFIIEGIKMQEDSVHMSAAASTQQWQLRLTVLQEEIRKLNVLIYHVLNVEEKAFQPELLAAFNEDTFGRFVMPRVFRAARPRRVVLPWIIERARVWGGEVEANALKKQLPFTSRFLYDRVWYPYFARHVVAAMKTLDTSLTEMPLIENNESWFGCNIQ